MTTMQCFIDFSKALGTKLYDAWCSLQLTQFGGSYSVERMVALDEYTRSTSLSRVVLVCISVPVFIVSVVLLQENVPLQSPASGWQSNYGFWTRAFVFGVVSTYGFASQVGPMLDVDPLSSRQTTVFCSCTGIGIIAIGVVASELWVFPIPFFTLSLSWVWMVLFVGILRALLGARGFRQIRMQRESLRRMNVFSSLQGLMCAAYPAYQVLFNRVSGTYYELPVLLLLPVFKLIMRSASAFMIVNKEDRIPEQVVFSVDFFDALYRATFLQSLSTTSIAVIMIIDLVQTLIEMHDLHQRTQSILAKYNELSGISHLRDSHGNLLNAVRSIYYESKPFRLQGVRVRSCIPHCLSLEGISFLNQIEGFTQFQQQGVACQDSGDLSRFIPILSPSSSAPRHQLLMLCKHGEALD